MLDLTKSFNKFYPKSQTVSKGVFLNKLAWTIEIIVALIGVLIGVLVVLKSQNIETVSGISSRADPTLDDLLFGLIFIIVAIVELTKIPLATAVYFAARLSWRLIFLLALFLVNVSTFETIVTGFERINRTRTADIEKLYVKKASLEKKIFNIRSNQDEERLQKNINELTNRQTELLGSKTQIETQAAGQKKSLQDQSANQGKVDGLKRELKKAENNEEKYSIKKDNLERDLRNAKWNQLNLKKNLQLQLEETNEKYEEAIKRREKYSKELSDIENAISSGNQSKINKIENQKNKNLIPIDKEIRQISSELEVLRNRKQNLSEKGQQSDQELTLIEVELKNIIEKIDDEAPDNQIFRVAKWFKGLYQENFEKKIDEIEEEISDLSKYKSNPKQFIFFSKKLTESEARNIEDEISRLNQRKIDLIELKAYQNRTAKIKTVYADIPEGARVLAFWAWFGVLSGIISVTGTMLAFASLNLQDPRMHEIREKKTAGWYGASYRFSKVFVLLSKYIWGYIKKLKNPKIVEKEIEVEKIVEKIVEKPVGEKIVYQKVEVPKEVVQKELVYVPLPTDNPELLKKGKFTSSKEKVKNNK